MRNRYVAFPRDYFFSWLRTIPTSIPRIEATDAAGFYPPPAPPFQEQLEKIGKSPHNDMNEIGRIEDFLDLIDGALMDDPYELGKVVLDLRSIERHFKVDDQYIHPMTKIPCDPPIPLPELKQRIAEYVEDKKLEYQVEIKIKTREVRLARIRVKRQELNQQIDNYYEHQNINEELLKRLMKQLYQLDEEESGLRQGIAYSQHPEFIKKKIQARLELQDSQLTDASIENELNILIWQLEAAQEKNKQFISRQSSSLFAMNRGIMCVIEDDEKGLKSKM